MTKKRGDDQYGYDPEHAAARSLFDRLERQAEQRPDKPARKLSDVLKLPKVTPTTKRGGTWASMTIKKILDRAA